MKIIYYLLLPAVLCGMYSNPASAQTIDWGAGKNVHALARHFFGAHSDPFISNASGKMESTDLSLTTAVNPTNVDFITISNSRVDDMFNYVNDQLTNATSPVTVEYNYPILGEYINNLKPGIYIFDQSVTIPAGMTLTLDDGGDKNALYIFKIYGNFLCYGSVKMKSGFTGVNVFFQPLVNGQISNTFQGNLVAKAISLQPGSAPTGQMFSKTFFSFKQAKLDIPVDTDGDTVNDYLDDYPLDPLRAFNNDTKASPQTIAFEDLWPIKGDFDFNDLVMKSSYNYITNAQNVIVQVVGTYTLLATGGTQKNSFHIRFAGKNWAIKNLVPQNITGGILDNISDGTSFKLFDNMRDEMAEWNTIPGKYSNPKIYTLSFNIEKALNLTIGELNVDPYIVNTINNTLREVHLPTMSPTSMATTHQYTESDDVSQTKPYITKDGLPWAMEFPADHFDFPAEGKDISNAYLKLKDWVVSGGDKFTDWYSNKAFNSGYRNFDLIYIYDTH